MNPTDDQSADPSGVSRRTVLGGTVAVAVSAPMVAGVALATSAPSVAEAETVTVRVKVDGALERMSDIASHRSVRESYPVIAQSYEFALASAAVALELDGRTIKQARAVMGGAVGEAVNLRAGTRRRAAAPL